MILLYVANVHALSAEVRIYTIIIIYFIVQSCVVVCLRHMKKYGEKNSAYSEIRTFLVKNLLRNVHREIPMYFTINNISHTLLITRIKTRVFDRAR